MDIGLKSRYQTDAEFNKKIKSFTALTVLPVRDFIDGLLQLIDQDDLLQGSASYFQTHYI